MVSKASLVLLARNLFHYMAESSGSVLFTSHWSNRVSHAECGCERAFLLILSFLRIFYYMYWHQTLWFSALMLKKVEDPIIPHCNATIMNYALSNLRVKLAIVTHWGNSFSLDHILLIVPRKKDVINSETTDYPKLNFPFSGTPQNNSLPSFCSSISLTNSWIHLVQFLNQMN